jgi:hypothetical protein
MTVYVDDARIMARVGSITARWSHLTADTKEELLEFGSRIGLKKRWFQYCKTHCHSEGVCVHWHYDVTETKRQAAIRSGALPITRRELAAITIGRRKAL